MCTYIYIHTHIFTYIYTHIHMCVHVAGLKVFWIEKAAPEIRRGFLGICMAPV